MHGEAQDKLKLYFCCSAMSPGATSMDHHALKAGKQGQPAPVPQASLQQGSYEEDEEELYAMLPPVRESEDHFGGMTEPSTQLVPETELQDAPTVDQGAEAAAAPAQAAPNRSTAAMNQPPAAGLDGPAAHAQQARLQESLDEEADLAALPSQSQVCTAPHLLHCCHPSSAPRRHNSSTHGDRQA